MQTSSFVFVEHRCDVFVSLLLVKINGDLIFFHRSLVRLSGFKKLIGAFFHEENFSDYF